MGIFDKLTKKTEDSSETRASVEHSEEQQRVGRENSQTGEHGISHGAPFGHTADEEAVNVLGEGEGTEKAGGA